MMRRVLGWKQTSSTVEVRTQLALYDEIFQNADINFGPSTSAVAVAACEDPEVDYQVRDCL